MSSVRVAMIGAGRFANTVHYPSVFDLPGAEITAICDLDGARAKETADKYSVPARHSDYREMLDQTKPDAAYVVMPPGPMVPIALEVLSRGIPVFVEKPPGMKIADSQALAEAARRAGTFGMVGFNRCYNPAIVEARRRIAELGKITLVVAEFHKPPHPTYQGSGSFIVTDVIHSIALLHFLAGKPNSIQVNNRAIGDEGAVDMTTALLDFDSGAKGVLISNFTSGSRYERFEIHALNGGAYVLAPDTRAGDYPSAPTMVEIYVRGKKMEQLDGFELTGSNKIHRAFGYYDECRHFIECVKSGDRPRTNLDFAVEVMHSAEAIEAGQAAVALGRP